MKKIEEKIYKTKDLQNKFKQKNNEKTFNKLVYQNHIF